MKIRIFGNSIRWRLNRTEVERLARGHMLHCVVDLYPQSLRYSLRADTAGKTWSLTCADGHMALILPASIVAEWAHAENLSIDQDIPAAHQGSIRVLIEKDLECLHGSGENQDDCYPNPLAGNRENTSS